MRTYTKSSDVLTSQFKYLVVLAITTYKMLSYKILALLLLL